MLQKVIEFSLNNRFLVIAVVLLMAGAGVYSAIMLPVDAVPDMTNTQVTVITEAGSLSPVEVERLITYPIEAVMGGLPKVEEIRSISKFGISVVTIVFNESTDIYFARQVVQERVPLAASAIPSGYGPPEIGPLATALGEILQFEVRGPAYTPMQLRSMLDWDIAPKLRGVRGVTEINVHGGFFKTFEIRPDPERLSNFGITLDDIYRRVQANQGNNGGGYVVHNHEQRFIRGEALFTSIEEIRDIVIRSNANTSSLRLSDIADVEIAPMVRQGAASRDGRGEVVTGMVMMLIGENSREVVESCKLRLAELETTLPPGVKLEITYDRASLIGRTLATVKQNLLEGGILVMIVLLVMLGSFRAGLIVALAIPLSMLFAANLMYAMTISVSLMSLGAIDFGLIVDSSVIMVENCMHRLSNATDARPRTEIIRDAAVEVRGPTMFGELIIAVVYLPILMLQGVEGKLFRPMALTVLFALLGSLILSMTLMPALASLALPKVIPQGDGWLMRTLKRIYRPFLAFVIDRPWSIVSLALGIVVLSIPVAYHLGAEFMPRLEEGDILIEAERLPSSTIEEAEVMTTEVERLLGKFPEVRTVFCKTGRPEIANDVMGVQQTDVWVLLKARHQWRFGTTRESLVEEMDQLLSREIPGAMFGFMQPIEMRVNELVGGVKANVAAQLYGEDLDVLAQKSKEIENVMKGIPGSADVKADYQANLQTLSIRPRREALTRNGIDASAVLDVVESLGGRQAGVVYEGRARYPIVVRLPLNWRQDMARLELLPVATRSGHTIPLKEVAELVIEETPPTVEHDGGLRRTIVAANVRGRDMAGFVLEAQKEIAKQVSLPPGYEIRWGGDFQNLQSASRRLFLIGPLVLLLIFLLLHTSLKNVELSLLIFLAVPIAASGGVFALWFRELPFSISAGIGFIALFGIAVLNGLVWVHAAERLRENSASHTEIVLTTALSRLRPILMTALVAGLGFLPMAVSHGDGSELQRPLATVVIGGLVTSTLLTCLLLPAVYPWFAKRDAHTSPTN
jgi:heavy metal efflux system protein